MIRKLLAFTLAAPLAAAGAFAQTDSLSGTGTMDGTYGSDWSSSLHSAMLNDDGMTVRSEAEIATEWEDLSEEDREMLRRDCDDYEQQSGVTGSLDTGMTGTGTTTGTGTATGTGTLDTTTDLTTDGMGMTTVSMDQMEQICTAIEDL